MKDKLQLFDNRCYEGPLYFSTGNFSCNCSRNTNDFNCINIIDSARDIADASTKLKTFLLRRFFARYFRSCHNRSLMPELQRHPKRVKQIIMTSRQLPRSKKYITRVSLSTIIVTSFASIESLCNSCTFSSCENNLMIN